MSLLNVCRLVVLATVCVALAGPVARGQDVISPGLEVLEDALLEGEPSVRVRTSESAAERVELSDSEAASERLEIRVESGRYLWASRDDALLQSRQVGEYTYLSSADSPGEYIRITRLNDRLSYVEHLETAGGHVTYWGELSIRLGR